MAAYIGTFERKETKYVLQPWQIKPFKEALSAHMRLDDYGETRIDSLYFDTPEHTLIQRSLEKPLYKEKLRIRSYGDAIPDSAVFVEIKKKFKGIVYKRRVRMSRAAAEAYFLGLSYEEAQEVFPLAKDKDALSDKNIQIAREIDAFRSRYQGIQPAMVISCKREAWKETAPENAANEVRITFDEDISYVDVLGKPFNYDFVLLHEGEWFALDQGKAVMEIKCGAAYPMWLVQLLDRFDIYPQSFSKYGRAFLETRKCLNAS